MSYLQIMFHIVLRTYRSEPTINPDHERNLYEYMFALCTSWKVKIYRIGGMPEHVHLLVSLPANLSLSRFVQDLKVSTSKWMKASPDFPHFNGWSKEYAGFTCGLREKDMIINYIKNQKEHHKKKTFAEEYREFLEENGIVINEKYFLVD